MKHGICPIKNRTRSDIYMWALCVSSHIELLLHYPGAGGGGELGINRARMCVSKISEGYGSLFGFK